jgi:hypothetical protein
MTQHPHQQLIAVQFAVTHAAAAQLRSNQLPAGMNDRKTTLHFQQKRAKCMYTSKQEIDSMYRNAKQCDSGAEEMKQA